MSNFTITVKNINIHIPHSIIIQLLSCFNPSNLFFLIDNYPHIAYLVRNNLRSFVDAYRNHRDFLDEIIWFTSNTSNTSNTFDSFIDVLRMHHYITITDMEYFNDQIALHIPDQKLTIPKSPILLYKFKLFTYLLSKKIGFRMCFRLIRVFLTDFDIDVEADFTVFEPEEMQNYLNILIKLLELYPDFCQFENDSDDNIYFIYDVVYHFEDIPTEDFDLSYNTIDNMISHGAHSHEAFKYILKSEETRQLFITYLDMGFSSKNASYLVDNPPTQNQIEQFRTLNYEIQADLLFDIIYKNNH